MTSIVMKIFAVRAVLEDYQAASVIQTQAAELEAEGAAK